MKKVNLIILFMIPCLAFSQESPLNVLFNKYSGQEGYTSVHITKYMFQLFAEISDENEDKEFKDVTSKLNAIKILALSDDATEKQRKTFKSGLISSLPGSVYKDLMIIKEGKKEITFKIKDDGKKISELVMFVDENDESVLIYLDGDINLRNISKLSKSMKIDGFEHLEKVDKENKTNK